jgi:8-oxo-dGTP pyrophosphatase MutT (NUDIX family)
MIVVGCFLKYNGKFLVLLRHSHKPDGNTWGLPSGKVEAGEKNTDAVLRELEEESGYSARLTELKHLGDYKFISSSGTPYTYATYEINLSSPLKIHLEEEAHADHKWVTAQECYQMKKLIPGFHELLKLVGYIE